MKIQSYKTLSSSIINDYRKHKMALPRIKKHLYE